MKFRNTKKEVFCPLCRTRRTMKYSSQLSVLNYLQIILVSSALNYFLWPIFREKSFITLFVVWPAFEVAYKTFYRKEIPCPECGFDATWYKRDVKVAKRLVEEFWVQKNSVDPKLSEEVEPNFEDAPQLEETFSTEFDEPIVQI